MVNTYMMYICMYVYMYIIYSKQWLTTFLEFSLYYFTILPSAENNDKSGAVLNRLHPVTHPHLGLI